MAVFDREMAKRARENRENERERMIERNEEEEETGSHFNVLYHFYQQKIHW